MRKMKHINFSFLFIVLLFVGCGGSFLLQEKGEPMQQPQEATADITLDKALSLVQACEEAYGKVEDYTAVLYKEERLKSSALRPKETIFVKYRKPNQIYMKWVEEPNKGMELIYPVRDQKLVVEPGGLLDVITPKMYLNPKDNLAMVHNRHPVTEAHLGFLVDRYIADFKSAKEKGEVKVLLSEGVQLGEESVDQIEVFLLGEGYYCARSVITFHQETHLPVSVEFYDEKNLLFERYRYTQFQANVGLTDLDFNEENSEYDF